MPKVSIIVPIFNEEKYIEGCIESILKSTYQDFELILVDDGSNDNSVNLCEDFARNNKNIFVYKLNRGGVSRARNYGVTKARGEYIWFVDGDDKVYPEALEFLMEGIEEKECDLVIGKYNSNRKNIQSEKVGIYNITDYIAEFCCETGYYYHVLWNKLYKRSIIQDNQLRFKEHYSFAEDNIFNCDYLPYCKKVNYIDKKVYFYSDKNSYNKSVEISEEKEQNIINVLMESFRKKRELIKKNGLNKEIEYRLNNIFFNAIHSENKLIKGFGYHILLKKIWNSFEFSYVLKFGNGVKGKTATLVKVLKIFNVFNIYCMVLELK